jgi:hypothetical protein
VKLFVESTERPPLRVTRTRYSPGLASGPAMRGSSVVVRPELLVLVL